MSSPSLVEDQGQYPAGQESYYSNGNLQKVNPWETFFTKQGDFQGRANRAEYWAGAAYAVAWSLVSFFVIGFLTVISDVLASLAAILMLLSGAYLIYLTVVLYIRRFHDMSQSGFLILLYLIPFAGWVLFFFMGIKGSDPENKYGEPRIS